MSDLFHHSRRLVTGGRLEMRRLKGTGLLRADDWESHGQFLLAHLIHRGPVVEFVSTDTTARPIMSLFNGSSDMWHGAYLNGKIDCDGSSVLVKGFSLAERVNIGRGPTRLLLHPAREVCIGTTTSHTQDVRRHYWLTSYFGPPFDLSIGSVSLVCRRKKKQQDRALSWAKYWHLPVESAELQARVDHGGSIVATDLVVDHLLTILTFAQGRRVSYSRYTDNRANGESYESWTQRVVDPISFGHDLLYDHDVQPFLDAVVPAYLAMRKEVQEQLMLSIYLLDSAKCNPNIEESTMLVATAWEVIADILTERSTMSPAIEDLRSRLKAVLAGWRKDFPTEDKDSFYQGRVLRALDWDRVQTKLRSVLSGRQLSAEKLGTDFRSFNMVRGSIVHKGCPPDGCSYLDVAELNRRMVFAGDLVIMKCLGYDGAVVDRSGNTTWKTRSDMTAFQD